MTNYIIIALLTPITIVALLIIVSSVLRVIEYHRMRKNVKAILDAMARDSKANNVVNFRKG